MKLHEILKDLIQDMPLENPQVYGLTDDSRQVEKGFLFFAVKGEHFDGNNFVQDAIKKGAVAVITHTYIEADVPVIVVSDVVKISARCAKRFYPSDNLKKFAVTGTNGKTSVVSYIQQILERMHIKTATIGTIGLQMSSEQEPIPLYGDNTTPNPIVLNKVLHDLEMKNYQAVAIEFSSIGLVQGRVESLMLDGAGITNFTQDHLDYHGTMQDYLKAKLLILKSLKKEVSFVVNKDINAYESIVEEIQGQNIKQFTFGKKQADLTLISQNLTPEGQEVHIGWNDKVYSLKLPVYGDFQVENMLMALGIISNIYADLHKIIPLIQTLKAPKGRLEKVRMLKNNAQIFIDYAHTPDALEKALKSLRKHASGALVCLFGCGGNRDKTKRPLMGKIAFEYADKVYITDDNPRYEDPLAIRNEIAIACPKALLIAGRAEAIKTALQDLEKESILLIAGKGHETYQIIQGIKYHLSDIEEVLNYQE